MPLRNGIETAQWIRNFEKVRKKRPVFIIGLTGHEEDEIRALCIKAGMNIVLLKPINKNDLARVMKEFSII